MKAVPVRLVLSLAFLITSFLGFCAGSLQAQDIGSWDFEGGDLTGTVGSTLGEMSYADGAGGATQVATKFGTATSFTIPKINGVEAKVMKFPAATTPQGYT